MDQLVICLFFLFIILLCLFNNNNSENYKASTVNKTWPKAPIDQWGDKINWIKNNQGKWQMILNQSNPIGSY